MKAGGKDLDKKLRVMVIAAFITSVLAIYAVHWQYYRAFGRELQENYLAFSRFAASDADIFTPFWEKLDGEEARTVIAYRRGASIDQAEKERLQERLVEPFISHHREAGKEFAAIVITVPVKVGGKYEVMAVGEDGSILEFTFGARGRAYEPWSP